MFEDPKDFQPNSSKGRAFLEDGCWLYISQSNRDLYVKVDEANARHALKQETFKGHHVLNIQLGQPPMPCEPVFGTYDGWVFNGSSLANVALVHPAVAEKLDKQFKKLTSTIVEAKESDVPPPDKVGKSKLHLT